MIVRKIDIPNRIRPLVPPGLHRSVRLVANSTRKTAFISAKVLDGPFFVGLWLFRWSLPADQNGLM